MKHTVIYLFALLFAFQTNAQSVSFEFSDGIQNMTLKSKMERQMSRLLTAINRACQNGTDINYTGLDISNDASASLGMTWNNLRFTTEDTAYTEHCIGLPGKKGGYRVQNIGVEVIPLRDDEYDGEWRREIYVDFDRMGKIIDFNFTLGVNMYSEILKKGEELGDLDRRMQIINWCEHFAKAYCDKNMNFLQEIFSDDALIITGRMSMKKAPGDALAMTPEVKYTQQTKQQYLSNLKRAFATNKFINVKFDNYTVVRHGSKPDYYGVTLSQKWHADRYSDEGTVFLVWDFSNEDEPRILVRTWQPEGTPENEVFTLSKFRLR